MDDGQCTAQTESFYTLLGVRADGVAPVVDLVAADQVRDITARAEAFLREHASCESVEIWRDGALLKSHHRHGPKSAL